MTSMCVIRSGSLRLALCVLLGRGRLELEPNIAFVANHPRIVTGLDHEGLAWPDFSLGAVLVDYVDSARLDDSDMPHLAALGSGDRLNALRLPPSGFECKAGCRRASDSNHVYLRLIRRPGLIGCIETARFNTRHASLRSSLKEPGERS
jgi:hypothetical protein